MSDHDPNEPRLSRMSLDSLKQKLETDRAKHAAFKADVESRTEEAKNAKPKGVSPMWIVVVICVALLVVLGIVFVFKPAALSEWGITIDEQNIQIDELVIDAGPPAVDTGPAAAEEPSSMRRRRVSTTMDGDGTTTMDGLGGDTTDPIGGIDPENDPLGGLPTH